jgi:hypothetical protein
MGIFTSAVSLFLVLNVIPWRTNWAIYIYDGPSYFPVAERYGWPYAYLHRYIDQGLPDHVTEWSVIEDNRLFHVVDNMVICTALAFLLTLLIAWGLHHTDNRRSGLQSSSLDVSSSGQ